MKSLLVRLTSITSNMYLYLNREKVGKVSSTLMKQPTIRRCLNELKKHHPDTYYHSLRVARLSIDLAIENKLPMPTVKLLGKAALLHDYGKHKIDPEILSKEGGLNKRELEIMREHPHVGMMELKKFISKQVGEIIACHHDFKTHTDHLSRYGTCNPTLVNQIVAAADMYDALCCPRAYKKAYGVEKVKTIMNEEFSGRRQLIDQLIRRPLNPGLEPSTI